MRFRHIRNFDSCYLFNDLCRIFFESSGDFTVVSISIAARVSNPVTAETGIPPFMMKLYGIRLRLVLLNSHVNEKMDVCSLRKYSK